MSTSTYTTLKKSIKALQFMSGKKLRLKKINKDYAKTKLSRKSE